MYDRKDLPYAADREQTAVAKGVGEGGVGVWDQQVKLSYAERRNTVLPQSPGSSAVCWPEP